MSPASPSSATQAMRILAPCALVSLSACQPMPLEVAENYCIGAAQESQYHYPIGSVGIGIGSGGYSGVGFGFEIPHTAFMGSTPDEVYANCVRNRSGQYPTHPYSSLPASQM